MEEDREMAPMKSSPVINSRQSPQQHREDEVQVDDAEQQTGEELLACSTHHPCAPADEVFDIQTTIDPSYIISLIRKLVPIDERQCDDLQRLSEGNNRQSKENDQMVNGTFSPKTNGSPNKNGNRETMRPVGLEHSSVSAGTDYKHSDPPKKLAREEAWEDSGCILWDLAANKEHAELMVQNLVLEVLLANLITSDSVRISEISLGILGNLACHEALMNQFTTTNTLLETLVDQVFSNDALCLCEVFRLLTLGLQGCQRAMWARALQSDQILSRVLWITENTLNPTLVEKISGFFLAIMENQHEVAPILFPTLIKLGLPELLVNLLALEMGKVTTDRMLERYPALDSVLRAIEALSVMDDYSERICSNKEVLQMAMELIKIPEKQEISSSCVTAAILIANLLADSPDLASKLSEDFLLLQSLLDLFPFTSEDFEARYALWSLVGRLLFHIQEAEMLPSKLNQFVWILVNHSDIIEDALLESEWGRSLEHDTTTITEAKRGSKTVAIKCIVKILNQWNSVKDKVFEESCDADKDPTGKLIVDDRDVQRLLDCCLTHTSFE
ncbi:uncharacterized protein LOC130811663 isoform X3 [Amaranthus tricolor]|uniref:uncharacterized protein LOC130811663 isoform X3 n=1 Tax=Amaranthus tricolor TaxID=29722 RepID=UPI00258D75F9|nr:uncharacterized protein LOC130811663 isoform X3 [Amaranthus tricolor]